MGDISSVLTDMDCLDLSADGRVICRPRGLASMALGGEGVSRSSSAGTKAEAFGSSRTPGYVPSAKERCF